MHGAVLLWQHCQSGIDTVACTCKMHSASWQPAYSVQSMGSADAHSRLCAAMVLQSTQPRDIHVHGKSLHLACHERCCPYQDCPAVAEAGALVLDFGIVPDSAGVQGLEAALDNAVHNGADVLITSGAGGALPLIPL